METQSTHCRCGHIPKTTYRLWHKWLLVLYVIVISFIGMKPLIMQQLFVRAWSYMDSQLYGEAIRMYKKAIFLDTHNARLREELGHAYRAAGDIRKATEAYQHAIGIDPKNQEACLHVGLIFMMQEKYGEAVPYFETIRSLGPDNTGNRQDNILDFYKSALWMLNKCYEVLGDLDSQEGILRDLSRHYPQDNLFKNQ